LSFAHAGRPDHDDVLGHDVFGDVGREFLAALAIAQGNGNGALCGLLTDDMLVELSDDLARGELVECEVLFFGGGWKINCHLFGFNPSSVPRSMSKARFAIRARLQPSVPH